MAGAATPGTQSVLPSHSVQEMVINNGPQIPQIYLNNLQNVDESTTPTPLMDAPSVDLSLLHSSSPQQLANFRSLLTSWGCFQLVNHGISIELLDHVRRVTTDFFRLPQEEKQNCARSAAGTEGYGTDTAYHNHTLNWNDRLRLHVYPPNRRLLQFWPLSPPNFRSTYFNHVPNCSLLTSHQLYFYREVVEDFAAESQRVMKTLLGAMAAALNLEMNTFLEQYGEEGVMVGRFNLYPPCPRPDKVLGIKPHTDGTVITLLLQDSQVEGLHVKKGDEWFRVRALSDAIFVIVGDQMEIMSNGLFKGAFHKVTTNREKERISLAMLCYPHPGNEIGPASELVTGERPQLFRKTKCYSKIKVQIDPTDIERAIDLLRI